MYKVKFTLVWGSQDMCCSAGRSLQKSAGGAIIGACCAAFNVEVMSGRVTAAPCVNA